MIDQANLTGSLILALAGDDAIEADQLEAIESVARVSALTGSKQSLRQLAAILLIHSRAPHAIAARSERLWYEAAGVMYELARDGDKLAAAALINGCTDRADEGDEDAALLLNNIVSVLPAETVAFAVAGR